MSLRLTVWPACLAKRCSKSNSAVVKFTSVPPSVTLLRPSWTTNEPTTTGAIVRSAGVARRRWVFNRANNVGGRTGFAK